MTIPAHKPELVINYSPTLDLRITFAFAQGYEDVSLPEYRFEVQCRLRHASGSFAYSGSNVSFDIKSFARFSTELQGLSHGLIQEASLKSVGEMVVLRLEGNSRALVATLEIREYLVPEKATLNATFDVDYDLFVNKLSADIDCFVEELRRVQPSPPEWTK
jgi:hypothetical protein